MPQLRDIRYNPAIDYYRLLGVPSSASPDEIRRVFRRKAKDVHPDRNPTRRAWARQQFQQINLAYSVLIDPQLRMAYDRQRLFYLQQAFNASPAQTADAGRRPIKQYQKEIFLVLIISGIVGALITVLRVVAPWSNSLSSIQSPPIFDVQSPSPIAPWESYERQMCTDPNIQIHVPANGQIADRELVPCITAKGTDFASYQLMLGTFDSAIANQVQWQWLAGSQQPVQQGSALDGMSGKPFRNLARGRYVLRLIVQLQDQKTRMCDSLFSLAESRP